MKREFDISTFAGAEAHTGILLLENRFVTIGRMARFLTNKLGDSFL